MPGGAKKALTARQARALVAAPPAGDVVRETRRQLAAELVDELDVIDARIKTAKKQLTALVAQNRGVPCECAPNRPLHSRPSPGR